MAYIIDKDKATLTKSEKAVYNSWTEDYKEVMGMIGSIINELHTMRIKELGRDKGLDMDYGDWQFDHQKEEFVKKRNLPEPEMKIPGKETVNSEG